jgi:hypothetical protein
VLSGAVQATPQRRMLRIKREAKKKEKRFIWDEILSFY